MKVALISDTHGQLPDPDLFEGADLIIHAGDVGPDYQRPQWFAQAFEPWQHALPAPLWGTWGNHDFPDKTPAVDNFLISELRGLGGELVWFSPWSPTFGGWAWMRSEPELTEIYSKIPTNTTVIVSHTPPYHLCDWTEKFGQVHCGSKALRVRMGELPNLHTVVCGHIHEGGREALLKRDDNKDIRVLNVSCVDEEYRMIKEPIVWVEWRD